MKGQAALMILIFLSCFIVLVKQPVKAQTVEGQSSLLREPFKEDTIGVNNILEEEFLFTDEHGHQISLRFKRINNFLLLIFKSEDGIFIDPCLPMLEKSYDGAGYSPVIFNVKATGNGLTSICLSEKMKTPVFYIRIFSRVNYSSALYIFQNT